ncbi:MAG TPA: BTAD domain-containing putative transcriptional regulator [Candidatus Elarobacter sp.]
MVDRRRVLQRIRRAAVPLIALVAPAGYGKSYIAQRIAREDPHWATIDMSAARTQAALVHALGAFPVMDGAADLATLIESWRAFPDPVTLILENLETATDPGVTEAVSALVQARPVKGKLILCGRQALPIRLSDLAAPHLVATMRADDLRFDGTEMAQLFAETDADATALFRVSRFTQGWPVVALYVQRLVQEEALASHSDAISDQLLGELFEYVQAQVLEKLPLPTFRALVAACGWSDLTVAEIEVAHEAPGAIDDLVDNHQLARIAPLERADVHPLIRRAVMRLHRRELTASMRRLAERFEADEQFARAAECYLSVGDVQVAADCAMQVDGGFLTLVGTRPAIESHETAGFAMNPEIRLAVAAARRLIEPSRNLPREAMSVLETTRGETQALDEAALGITVLTLLDAGRTAEAAALFDNAPPDTGDTLNGPGLVALTARLALLAQQGRFEEGMAVWQPRRRRVHGNPVWLAQLIRFEVQAARSYARWEVEHEALERMVSLARAGRAAPVIGLALAEAVFGAWLAGEDDLYEAYRTELSLLVDRYDIPALLRFTLAVSGRAPRVGRSNVPLWDACAFLIAAAAAQDGAVAATYAQAALEAADVAEVPLVRVLARVAAAEKHGSARARLREALAIADSITGSPLRDAVNALVERGEARGMLAPLVNRLRHRTSVVAAVEDAPLMVSLADGTVFRGEERVDVSEGVLALLAALAVEAPAASRDRLVDRLWPDLQDESAYNALKMCVHRARQQLGDAGAVVVSRRGYALAPEVQVDLRWLQRMLERVRRNAVTNDDVPALEESFARLARGRPAAFGNWEWFEPIESTLEAATHEIGAFLGTRALLAGDHVRALTIAQTLTKLDPLDERARQVAISAHLAANDRGAAILEFRGYKALLETELDVEPSPDLKRLLETS